jgi:hypothetical protein
MRGKQFTYRLVDELIPIGKKPDRTEALSRLALKYFTSHGPAQLKDFAWWSGLSMKDATEALGSIKSKLSEQSANGKTYWSLPVRTKKTQENAFLLSIYDEYTIAYKDRSDISAARDIEKFITMGNALTAVIIINGKAAGTWRRKLAKDKVTVKTNLFRKLNRGEQKALGKAVQTYGNFLGLKTTLI